MIISQIENPKNIAKLYQYQYPSCDILGFCKIYQWGKLGKGKQDLSVLFLITHKNL